MSEATKDRDQRVEAAEEYWRTNNCSFWEAASHFNLKNHKTLSNRIHGKHASASQLGGKNRILSLAQEAVILAYGRSQAYAGWPCD